MSSKKKSTLSTVTASFLGLMLAIIFLPATVVFCFCMLPTYIAALTDTQPGKTAWITVGSMNLAGTVPAWISLWQMGRQMDHAILLLFQPMTILIAYGGAIIGWGFYIYLPLLAERLLIVHKGRRLREVAHQQQNLTKKWGQEVGLKQ